MFAEAMYQRRVPCFTLDRLLSMQRENMRRIVRHAYETAPFYREFMLRQGLRPEDFRTVADLARLPLIDRACVQENPSAFRSGKFDPKECIALHSGSGATTEWDPGSTLKRLAHRERDRMVWLKAGAIGFGHRQLHIVSPEASSLTARGLWDRKVKTPRFVAERHFIDPLQPYEEVVAALERIRPDLVFSYGSYLEHFARFVHAHGIRPVMPKVWVYSADALSAHWRGLIERESGCQVFSHYSTTETGQIGYECEQRRGFHVNIDLVALRLIGENGAEAQPGEVGEVVVSNLLNRAMVLLNYRLGDLAEAAGESCSCGRNLPLLRNLHGRVSETLQTLDGRTYSSTTLLGKFAEELQSALKVQVVSLAPGRIRWRIVPSRNLDRDAFRSRLLRRCGEVLGETALADVHYVEDIAATPHGKFRCVVPPAEASAERKLNGGSC
jgi:phenylacetate-CoA ligase